MAISAIFEISALATVLDGQPLAALGAAAGQHQTAGTGSHARTETVGTGTMNFAWVVSALHASNLVARNSRQNKHMWVQKKAGKGTQAAYRCQGALQGEIRQTLWITSARSV